MTILKRIRSLFRHPPQHRPGRKAAPRRVPRSHPLDVQRLEDRLLLDGMSLVGNWNGGAPRYSDVWAEGNFAYIGHVDLQRGLDIIDISDPTNPRQVANFRGSADNNIRDVEVQNGIGFFSSDTGGGVYVVDVSDPSNPVELYRITTADGGTNRVSVL